MREVMGADSRSAAWSPTWPRPTTTTVRAVDAFEIARRIFEGEIIDAKDVADVS